MIKIYQMNDCDWYAAETERDAVDLMKQAMNCDFTELQQDYDVNPRVLHESEMKQLWFNEECGEVKKTFNRKLKEMIQEGCKFPCFFASTEY